MARPRYQIWDEVSKVITPSGEVFTAEQWMDQWPMARLEEVVLVISGGVVNGAFCGVYDDFVDMYEKMGCDFSNCTTRQEHLDAIEAFEDKRNAQSSEGVVSAEDRIAAALEAQVMMSMSDATEETTTETTEEV